MTAIHSSTIEVGVRAPLKRVTAAAEAPPSLTQYAEPKWNEYSVTVPDNTMSPCFRKDEIIHLDTLKAISPDAYVLITRKSRRAGYSPITLIAKLVQDLGNRLILEKYKPSKMLEIKTNAILSVHRIVGKSEAETAVPNELKSEEQVSRQVHHMEFNKRKGRRLQTLLAKLAEDRFFRPENVLTTHGVHWLRIQDPDGYFVAQIPITSEEAAAFTRITH